MAGGAIPKRIGLALSGGGCRAIAFHLGCLRSLHRHGVLEQVGLVSGVSGGSVIAAMYCYGEESFEQFDQQVQDLLRRGLFWSMVLHAVNPLRAIPGLFMAALTLTFTLSCYLVAATLWVVTRLLPLSGLLRATRALAALPPPRRVTRTDALVAALRTRLFHDKTLKTTRRREDLDVVLNACDLRTGAAVRFGNRESGCWRYGGGRLRDNGIPLALAVAASAAYPGFLPTLERTFSFIPAADDQPDVTATLSITDGGVYDNLGVTCMEPGRVAEYSTNAYAAEYILCCDAGTGLYVEPVKATFWPARMYRSFASVFRRANDTLKSKLHDHRKAGRIRGFLYAYLGQRDDRLTDLPAGFIPRERVASYPTDFSSVRDDDLEALTGRGEQLVTMLITRHLPEFLDQPPPPD